MTDRPDLAEVMTYYAEGIPAQRVHPAAGLFPMASEDEFAKLVENIAEQGLAVPILITETGELLDGRNRLLACYLASVEPTFQTSRAPDLWATVASLNLHRRHLTPSQRGIIAAELTKHLTVEAAERMRAGVADADPSASGRKGRAVDQAGAQMGVSGRTVQRAKRVIEAAPELADQVRAGDLTLVEAEKAIKAAPAPAPRQIKHPFEQAKVNPRKGSRPGATSWSQRVQQISADCPINNFSDDQVAELWGAAKYLYDYCRGTIIMRDREWSPSDLGDGGLATDGRGWLELRSNPAEPAARAECERITIEAGPGPTRSEPDARIDTGAHDPRGDILDLLVRAGRPLTVIEIHEELPDIYRVAYKEDIWLRALLGSLLKARRISRTQRDGSSASKVPADAPDRDERLVYSPRPALGR